MLQGLGLHIVVISRAAVVVLVEIDMVLKRELS